MKRFCNIMVSAMFTAALLFSLCSCDEVESGSKIQRGKITLEYYNTDDEAIANRDIAFKLYTNFAPDTIEHFKYLVSKGYFNDTAVSNVSDSYLEMGAYSYASESDMKLVSKYDKQVAGNYYGVITSDYISGKKFTHDKSLARYTDDFSVRGEFAKNGVSGNSLSLSGGAIVLKRDYKGEKSVYNTGKGTFGIVFSGGTYFDSSSSYAIIGKLVSDDADSFDDDEASLDFAKSLLSFNKDDDGNYYYYYVNSTSEYYEANPTVSRYLKKNSDGEYFAMDESGKYTVEINSEDEEDKKLLDELGENGVYLQSQPYKKIIIKSVTMD